MLKKLRRRLAVIFTLFTGAVLAAVLAFSLWTAIQTEMAANELAFSTQFSQVLSQLLGQGAEEGAENKVVAESAPFLLSVRQNGKELPLVSEAGWTPRTSRDLLLERASQMAEISGSEVFYPGNAVEMLIEADGSTAVASAAADVPEAIAGGTAEASAAANTKEDTGSREVNGAAEASTDGSMVITVAGDVRIEGLSIFTLRGDAGEQYMASHVLLGTGEMNDPYEVTLLQELSGRNRAILMICLGYAALLLGGLLLLFLVNWLLAKLVLRPTAAAMQQQTDFVAAASHELRSPLAVVRSSLSAGRAAQEKEEAQKYHRAAEAEAARMSRLVEDLLLLAGGDAGRWQLRREEVDMDTLLIEARERFLPQAAKKQVALCLSLPEETLPPVAGDRDRLGQVLNILLDNALQYAPPNSEVRLEARLQKNKLALLVLDHGPGIADEIKPRVFERFYRAEESRADKNHFGLGLSVAQELAEMHGGQLLVQDTPGGGASFVFQLPQRGPAGKGDGTHKNL